MWYYEIINVSNKYIVLSYLLLLHCDVQLVYEEHKVKKN